MTCPFALKSNPGLISPSAVFGSAPAAEGGDAIEVPEHDSGDDDVGDRIGPVGDAVVLIAEEEAERRQEAGPDEGAEGGEEQEAAQVHAGDAGREGKDVVEGRGVSVSV